MWGEDATLLVVHIDLHAFVQERVSSRGDAFFFVERHP